MRVEEKIVVVTGGANGIGKALCHRFAAEGAKEVIVADIDDEAGRELAVQLGCCNITTNVASESDVQKLVDEVLKRFGRIDLFCSNAGVGVEGDYCAPDRDWLRSWEVNVMAHVYAARAVLPEMLRRGEGYLLQTISAAGLLTMLGSAPYAVAKHAALGLAEWLSITYGDRGIKVSALCPMGVRTGMLERAEFGGGTFLLDDAIEPDEVAEAVIRGLESEHFLIAPHAKAIDHFRRKADDYDRWLAAMRRLNAEMIPLKPQS